MTHSMRILTALAALLAIAGIASAQNAPCPECDPDGEDGTDSSYSSVDLGVVDEEDLEAVADTDVSASDSNNETFFVWLSICLSAFIENIDGVLENLGIDVDANADVYVSEHGVDIDAAVSEGGETIVDFDESPVGDLDGATFDAVAEVREATGADIDGGVGDVVPDGIDVDLCVLADVEVLAGDIVGCP